MPLDMSDPQGFNAFLFDAFNAFREVAVGVYPGDDPAAWSVPSNLMDDQGDPIINDVAVGPTTADSLANQYAYPLVWVAPQSYQPDYATSASDQGALQVQVVVFAADLDPWAALRKASTIGGRVVNNVEADRALESASTDTDVTGAWLTGYQLDFQASAGGDRAQLKYAQLQFDVNAKRLYR